MRQPSTRDTPPLTRESTPVRAKPDLPAWLIAVFLVLGTVAIYSPAMRCGFVNYDDESYVASNPYVQSGLTWEGVRWAWSHPVAGNWHPLTVWSHLVDCQLYRLKPWGHHLTSVLLHAFNAGLVFWLLQRRTGAVWRSLLVAALFAVHPLRVESVAWVSERKDVLSGFFGLLALIFYARYAKGKSEVRSPISEGDPKLESRNPRAEDRGQGTEGRSQRSEVRGQQSLFHLPSSIFYLLSLGCLALGLMTKPMLVTWPFVMLLLDYWPLGRMNIANRQLAIGNRKSQILFPLLVEKIPFFVLAAAASVVTFMVQKRAGSLVADQDLPMGGRCGNALLSYCRYLGKLFWPADLAVFYPHPVHWPMAQILLAGGVLLGISVLLILARRHYPFLLMGWLWFVGTLVPVIGLVQAGGQAMADRYTYLPSLGVLILTVWGAHELARSWRYQASAAWGIGGAVIVLCLVLTRKQIGYWQNSEALFRHAVAVTEHNALAHNNLGGALEQQGQINEAISHYREAIRLAPDYAVARNNLGATLTNQGQTDAAISQFQEALRLKPDYAEARNNLGTARVQQGQVDEAIHQYQEALRLKPDYAEAHNHLGTALLKQGQIDEAIRQYQAAIHLKPDYADAHNNLGSLLGKKGQANEAIHQFQEAIRLEPAHPLAHYNLGNLLLMKGQVDEAIRQLQEALRLNPDHAEAHYNLGVAFGSKGQTGEAITQYREAIRLNPGNADAHYNLGLALAGKGRTEDAIHCFEAALKVRPGYAEAHNHLGQALARQGQLEQAIQEFREALRLRSDYPGARQNLEAALATRGHSPTPPGDPTNR